MLLVSDMYAKYLTITLHEDLDEEALICKRLNRVIDGLFTYSYFIDLHILETHSFTQLMKAVTLYIRI
jgi:hypothetical protein